MYTRLLDSHPNSLIMSTTTIFNKFKNDLEGSIRNLFNLKEKIELLKKDQKEDKILNFFVSHALSKINSSLHYLNECSAMTTVNGMNEMLVDILGEINSYINDLVLHFEKVNDLKIFVPNSKQDGDFKDFIDMLITRVFGLSKVLFEGMSHDNVISNLNIKLKHVSSQVEGIKSAKAAIEGQKTEEIYSKAFENFSETAKIYEVLFYLLIFALTLFTVVSLIIFPYDVKNLVNFVAFKIIAVSLVVTLGTIFLRRAAHNRKLATQAHQTSLELQALPLFTRSLSDEQKQQIYFELASKYFGKEVDQTQHDKIGDLLQDQMKLSTELLRASTDMIKTVKTETLPKAETPQPKTEQ